MQCACAPGISSGWELTATEPYTPLGGDFKTLISRFPQASHTFWDRRRLLYAWIGTLLAGAGAMCISLAATGHGLTNPWPVFVLSVVAVAAERECIRLGPNLEVSVAPLAYVFAAVVFGPLAGIVVAAAGLLADLPRRDTDQPVLRWATWTAIRVIVAGSAGL